MASSNLAPSICLFIDNAFRIEIFPHRCKIATAIPLFNSEKTDLNQLQPHISFNLFFENLQNSQNSQIFSKHSVLAESQYGFQNNMLTTHAILEVLTTSYDQINNNKFTCIILLDFQKAFDTVCHTSLLSKLKGDESSSQFQWLTIAKIELLFLIFFSLILGLWLQRYSTNTKRYPPEKSF